MNQNYGSSLQAADPVKKRYTDNFVITDKLDSIIGATLKYGPSCDYRELKELNAVNTTSNITLHLQERRIKKTAKINKRLYSINNAGNQSDYEKQRMHTRLSQVTTLDYSGKNNRPSSQNN